MGSRTHCSPGWLQAPDRCEGHQRSTPSPRPPPPRTVPARPLPLRRSEPHRGRPREADRRKQQAAGFGERAWAAGADGRRSGGVRSPCMRHAAARRAGGRSVASRPTVGGHWEGMWGCYADSLVCARRGAVRHRGSGHTDYTVLAMHILSTAWGNVCRPAHGVTSSRQHPAQRAAVPRPGAASASPPSALAEIFQWIGARSRAIQGDLGDLRRS